jgi:hypothetical protein
MLVGACKSDRERQADIANGDDPLQALTANVQSTRYGRAFWLSQSDSNTALWQRARTYCEQNAVTPQGEKVNCGAVVAVAREETARHPDRRKPGALRP